MFIFTLVLAVKRALLLSHTVRSWRIHTIKRTPILNIKSQKQPRVALQYIIIRAFAVKKEVPHSPMKVYFPDGSKKTKPCIVLEK